MKIALVSHTPRLGGAERMLLNLARLFINDKDICIVVIHPALNEPNLKDGAFLPTLCDKEGILCWSVQSTSNYIFINNKNRNRTAHENARYKNELENTYRTLGIDVVLVNTLTSAAPVMAARALGLPVVIWVHGILDTYLIDKQYNASCRLLVDRLLVALCNETICCSAWTARYYENITQKYLIIIPNWTKPTGRPVAIPKDCTDF